MFVLLNSITILAVSTMFVFVFLRDHKSTSSRFFLLMVLGIITWLTVTILETVLNTSVYALLLTRLDFALGVLIGLFFVLFSYSFPYVLRLANRLYMLFLIIATSFIVLISLSPLVVTSVEAVDGGLLLHVGALYYLYALVLILLMLLGCVLLFIKFIRSDSFQRDQLKVVLTGVVSAVVIVLGTNLILSRFLGPTVSNYGVLGLLSFVFFTSYAMTRHRFLDVRVLLSRKVLVGAAIIASIVSIFVVLWQFTPVAISSMGGASFFLDSRMSEFVYFLAAISTLLSIAIAAYLFFHKPHNRLKISFAFIAFQIGLWGMIHLFGTVQTDPQVLIYFARASLIAVLFLPATFIYFVSVLGTRVYTKSILLLIFAPPFLMLLFSFSYLNIGGFYNGNVSYIDTRGGSLYYFFLPYFVLFIGSALYQLFRIYRLSNSTIIRRRTGYILLGALVSTGVGVMTNGILPVWFNVVPDPNLGVVSALFFTVIAAYSIVRHRLLEVRVLLKRGFISGFAYLFSVVAFVMVVWLLPPVDAGRYDLSLLIFIFSLSLFVHVLLWRPLRRLLYRLFPREVMDLHKLTDEEEYILTKTTSAEDFVGKFVSDILRRIPVDPIVFYVYDHFSGSFRLIHPRTEFRYVDSGSEWLDEIMRLEEMNVVRVVDVTHRKLLSKAESHASELILPLKLGERFVGVIFVGSRIDGEPFSDSDIEFFVKMREVGSQALWNVLHLEYSTKNYISGTS